MTSVYALAREFGTEWRDLPAAAQQLVLSDFSDLLRDEYDTPDPTVAHEVAAENTLDAASEYRVRIGRNNLAAYADSLAAGARFHAA
jgi:hypothetical protein